MPSDMSVLPVPHSPTMRTDRADLRCLARPEMVQCLRGKRLAQEHLDRRGDRIVRPLQGRVHLDYAGAELLRKGAEVFIASFHASLL